MQAIESSGVNRKWSTNLKALLRSYEEWINENRETIQEHLEHYVLHGVPKDFKFNPFIPEKKPWEDLCRDLIRHAIWFIECFEKNGLQNAYDVSLAQHAFACA